MSTKREKTTRVVLSLVCFTAYISLFIAVVASAFQVSLAQPLLG